MKKRDPSAYQSMPWKNGAGTTIEIAVYPEHAQLDEFEWRVSRAKVVSDGAFSHFNGIDRTLALLQGQGLRLSCDGVAQQVDSKNGAVTFSGDASVYAELIDGPIIDFNVMSRRSVCAHQLTAWSGKVSQPLPQDTVLLYCAQGTGKLITSDNICSFNQDETVLFSADEPVARYTLEADENSRFICVQIKKI